MPSVMWITVGCLALLLDAAALIVLRRMLAAYRARLFKEVGGFLTDPATGLNSRAGLMFALGDKVVYAEPPTAMILISLPGMAAVRADYGHRTADAVLRKLADRLAGGIRLSTDEFACLNPTMPAEAGVRELVQRLMQPVDVRLGERTAALTVAVAAAVAPMDVSDDVSVVLSRANAALQVALSTGTGSVCFWRDDLPALPRQRDPNTVCALLDLGHGHQPQVVLGHSRDLVERHAIWLLAAHAVGVDGPDITDDAALPPADPDSDTCGRSRPPLVAATAQKVTFLADADVHHAPPAAAVGG